MKAIPVAEDIQNLSVSSVGSMFIVDMERCEHVVSYRIVLSTIIRLETMSKDDISTKRRIVEVRIKANDIRNFKVSESVDEQTIMTGIYASRIFQNLLRN